MKSKLLFGLMALGIASQVHAEEVRVTATASIRNPASQAQIISQCTSQGMRYVSHYTTVVGVAVEQFQYIITCAR